MTDSLSLTQNPSITVPGNSILARYRGAGISNLTPTQAQVDGWVGGGSEWLGRPENALLIGGGALFLNASRSTLLLSQTRLFLAEGAAALRPLFARSAMAALPLAAAGCAAESSDSTDSGTADGGVSHPPVFQSQESLGQVPCGSGSMIPDVDLEGSEGIGTCTNYTTGNHHLFRWVYQPMTSGVIQSILPLSFPPDQALRLSNGEIVVSVHEDLSVSNGEIVVSTHENSGLSFVNDTVGSERHEPFPASVDANRPSSSGRTVSSFRPNSPKGMVEAGGRIFVATANYDEVNRDYFQGTVMVFDPASSEFDVLRTTGYNPTSVARATYRGSPTIVVVNTGAMDRQGRPKSESRLDLFDETTGELRVSYALGNFVAGVGGEVAVHPDGRRIVLPTGDNSGRILVTDLETGTFRTLDLKDHGLTGDRVLLNPLQLSADGRYAFVGNFNDGHLYVVDLEDSHALTQRIPLDSSTIDGNGISEGVFQSGSLFVGVGPDLRRLSFAP